MVWSTPSKAFADLKNQPQQTYVHQSPYAMNQQHITKHLELSGMDEILIDKVKINYALKDVIPTDHGPTAPESLRNWKNKDWTQVR